MPVIELDWNNLNINEIEEPIKSDLLRLSKDKPTKAILYKRNNEWRIRKYNIKAPKDTEYHKFVKKVAKMLPELGINGIWTIQAAAKLWNLKKSPW